MWICSCVSGQTTMHFCHTCSLQQSYAINCERYLAYCAVQACFEQEMVPKWKELEMRCIACFYISQMQPIYIWLAVRLSGRIANLRHAVDTGTSDVYTLGVSCYFRFTCLLWCHNLWPPITAKFQFRQLYFACWEANVWTTNISGHGICVWSWQCKKVQGWAWVHVRVSCSICYLLSLTVYSRIAITFCISINSPSSNKVAISQALHDPHVHEGVTQCLTRYLVI